MKNYCFRTDAHIVVDSATSHGETGIGQMANSEIKHKMLGGDNVSKSTITDRFLVLESCDCTTDINSLYHYGVVLRRANGNPDEIFFCNLDYDVYPRYGLEEGDVVCAELQQTCKTPWGAYNFDDYTVIKIKLINKLKWMNLK